MRSFRLLCVMAAAAAIAAMSSSPAAAHQDGCHSAHSCPSDHHTYVWFDADGQGWSCARPGSDTYDPTRDTMLIMYAGLPYYCYAYGAPAPPPSEPAPPPADPAPPVEPPPTDPGAATEPAAPLPVYVGRVANGLFARPDQLRPRALHPFSADDNAYLYGLQWTQWGRAKTYGTGKGTANDCDPDCADGSFVRSRGAHVTLYRRREGGCHGQRALFYTRARLRWPERLHLRPFAVKLQAGCQTGGSRFG